MKAAGLTWASRSSVSADGPPFEVGTLAAKGGVRPTAQFAFELEDPVRRRKIAHAYRARVLPVLG